MSIACETRRGGSPLWVFRGSAPEHGTRGGAPLGTRNTGVARRSEHGTRGWRGLETRNTASRQLRNTEHTRHASLRLSPWTLSLSWGWQMKAAHAAWPFFREILSPGYIERAPSSAAERALQGAQHALWKRAFRPCVPRCVWVVPVTSIRLGIVNPTYSRGVEAP